MGKLIIRGYGKDADNETKLYAVTVGYSIVGFVVVSILIGAFSNYHAVGPGETVHGLRFLGDWVIGAAPARVVVALLIAAGVIGRIQHMKPQFDSVVSVFEEGIEGVSSKKETFSLKYSEISSVHTQDESSWKSVNINASGKVYQVYTVQCNQIAAEINKRRNV